MTKLVTLAGKPQARQIENINPNDLDDETAGILFIRLMDEYNNQVLSGWLTDLTRKTKNVIGDSLNYIGKKTGEAVRLVTDPQVVEGVSRGVAAVATRGGSEVARQSSGTFLDTIKSFIPGGSAPQTSQNLAAVGQGYKQAWNQHNITPWVIGGVAVLSAYFLLRKK